MEIPDEYLPITGAGRQELITIYLWSLDEAWEHHQKWSQQEKHNPKARGPFYRWVDARKLIVLAEQFKETGDNGILLQAISICALNDFAIPQWCSFPYLKAFREVRHFRVKSWDDSFGAPNLKGAQLEAKRRKREKRFGVYNRIIEIKKKDASIPIDRALFEKVGKEFGICGTLADKYYYSAKKDIEGIFDSPSGGIIKWLLNPYRLDEE